MQNAQTAPVEISAQQQAAATLANQLSLQTVQLLPSRNVTLRSEAGQHYRIRKATTKAGTEGEVNPDNVVATRLGSALHLQYGDGSSVTFVDFYNVCTDASYCSVQVAGQAHSGYYLAGDNAWGDVSAADGGTLVYAHGQRDILMAMSHGQEAVLDAFLATGDSAVLTYAVQPPVPTGLSGGIVMPALVAGLAIGLAGGSPSGGGSSGGGSDAAAVQAAARTQALNRIAAAAEANDAGDAKTPVSLYEAAGISGVQSVGVAAINDALNTEKVSGAKVDSVAKLQDLVNAYRMILAEANGSLPDETPTVHPGAAQFALVGANIGAAADSTTRMALLDDVIGAQQRDGVDRIAKINNLARIANGIQTVAAGGTADVTAADFGAIGVSGVNDTNVAAMLAAIAAQPDDGSATDQLSKLQSLVVTERPAAPVLAAIAADDVVSSSEAQAGYVMAGTGLAGATVRIDLGNGLTLAGGNSARVASDGTWTLAVTAADTQAFGQGTRTVRLTQTDAWGNTSDAASRSLGVDTQAPSVASVALSAATGVQNNTLNAGDEVTVKVTMSEVTRVDASVGAPSLKLNIGGMEVQAAYASGSGSTELLFKYTIQAGQTDANGIGIAANSLSAASGVLKDAAGNAAVISHGLVADNASYLVDTQSPSVASVAISSTTGVQNNTLNVGDEVTVKVMMSEVIQVDSSAGTPSLALDIGGTQVQAAYASGSGSTELLFKYTIQAGQTDANGIGIAANSLSAASGVLKDAAGNAAVISHGLVADNASYLVDTQSPSVASVAISSTTGVQNNTLNAGDEVTVKVMMSEVTQVDSSAGTPSLALDIGGTQVQAAYASGSGSTELLFKYTIQAGQTDANGIGIAANSLSAASGVLKDAAGNSAVISHGLVADNANFKVDTTIATPRITDNIPNGMQANGPVTFQFDFGEKVNGFALDDITVIGGTSGGTLTNTGIGVYQLTVSPPNTGSGDIQVSVRAGAVTDDAGNSSAASAVATQGYSLQGGRSTIELGTGMGNLIGKADVGGKWFYVWDKDGDGVLNDADKLSHDALDTLFQQDANGLVLTEGTTDTIRFATINNVHLALLKSNEFVTLPAALPAGWANASYWSSTAGGTEMHSSVQYPTGSTAVVESDSVLHYVALQVLN